MNALRGQLSDLWPGQALLSLKRARRIADKSRHQKYRGSKAILGANWKRGFVKIAVTVVKSDNDEFFIKRTCLERIDGIPKAHPLESFLSKLADVSREYLRRNIRFVIRVWMGTA